MASTPAMNGLRAKLYTLVLGGAAALLLLEICVRVVGYIQENRANRPSAQGTCRILCLGDSHTYGLGVPAEMTYPRQLERLLNQAGGEPRVDVLNAGLPGRNSSELLSDLPGQLAAYRPYLVIVLVGTNNEWNYTGRAAYRSSSLLLFDVHRVLWRSRVYRLARLILRDPHVRPPASAASRPGAAAQRPPSSPEVERLHSIAYRYLEQGKHAEANRYLEMAVDAGSTDPVDCFFVGDYFRNQKDFRRALAYYHRGILLAPDDPANENYSALKLLYIDAQDPLVLADIVSLVRTLHPDNPLAEDIIEMHEKGKSIGDTRLAAWLERDYWLIVAACRERHVPVLFQNYPSNQVKANAALARFARETGVPFVDQYALFDARMRREKKTFADYFQADAHCNAAGCEFMARHLYDKIQELRLFPAE